MNAFAQKLLGAVSAERLQDRLFTMVKIPSLTANARAMAEHYAGLLNQIGVPAQLRPLAGLPNSPGVWGYWKGRGDGPTLQMAGHLDTIHTPHVAPYVQGGRVYGRGAADMKSGLTAITEVIQVLGDAGVQLPGDLLVTAYDMHEHPVGHGEGCFDLIDAGFVGDAALVAEGPEDELAIAGKGTTIFDIELDSPAGSPHELHVQPGQTNPLHVGVTLAQRLIAWGAELSQQKIELLGTETLFFSQMHGGDFFNRLPGSVVIGGTRRFAPGRGIEAVRQELQGFADAAVAGTELTAKVTLQPMREGFRQPADAKIISAVRQAHKALTGAEMPLAGQLFGADNEFFINRAHIPAVCIGAGLGASHADLEYVDIDAVVLLAKKMLLATLLYYDLA